jgi:Leucine-rich repeat (LRR) protein
MLITQVLGLPKLEILDISKNDILSIPEDINRMTNLKFLAFERNQIKRLPLALGEMSNLAKLKFDENPLEFPPATALQLPADTKAVSMNEREKELCLQVKKFLRTASIRAKMRIGSEDDSRWAYFHDPLVAGMTTNFSSD